MTNTLPDSGEWMLGVEVPGQPLPPFVKLTVDFSRDYGTTQGINLSHIGWLPTITQVGSNRFGAKFSMDGVQGMFDATLEDDGSLRLKFLAPVKTEAIARPVYLDRDANARGPARRREAFARVARFAANDQRGAFPLVSRQAVATGLLNRIDNPKAINQGMTYTCGPAAFMYTFAIHDVVGYVQYVIDLYEYGVAHIGTLRVAPGRFRCDRVPDSMQGAQADWVALGSLRDSENWFWEYHTDELPFFHARSDFWTAEGVRGGTGPSEIESWFKSLGYSEVVNCEPPDDGNWEPTGARIPRAIANLAEASDRYRDGWKVCLRVCANFIEARTHDVAAAGGDEDHLIVLASPVEITSWVRFKFFTWGDFHNVGFNLTPEEFARSYWGFVAARR